MCSRGASRDGSRRERVRIGTNKMEKAAYVSRIKWTWVELLSYITGGARSNLYSGGSQSHSYSDKLSMISSKWKWNIILFLALHMRAAHRMKIRTEVEQRATGGETARGKIETTLFMTNLLNFAKWSIQFSFFFVAKLGNCFAFFCVYMCHFAQSQFHSAHMCNRKLSKWKLVTKETQRSEKGWTKCAAKEKSAMTTEDKTHRNIFAAH